MGVYRAGQHEVATINNNFMTTRKQSKNSLKNLKDISKRPDFKELSQKGAQRTNEVKKAKRKREEMLPLIYDLLNEYGIIDKTIEVIANQVADGSVKDALEVLKLVKPNELQQQQILGALEIQKVFITEKELKDTNKHIDDVINEQ